MIETEKKVDKGLAILKGVCCFIVFFQHFMECFMIYDLADQSNYRLANIVYFLPIKILTYGRVANFTFCMISGYFAASKRITSIRSLLNAIATRYVRLVLVLMAGSLLLGLCYFAGITPTEADRIVMLNDNLPTFQMDLLTLPRAFLFHSLNFAMWIVGYIFVGNVCAYLYSYISGKTKESKRVMVFYLILVGLLLALDCRSQYIEMIIVTMIGVPLKHFISVYGLKMDRIERYYWLFTVALGYCIVCVDLKIDFRYLSYIGALLFILGFKYLFKDVSSGMLVRFLSDYPIAVWAVHPAVIYTVCLRFFNSSSLSCDYRLGIAFLIAMICVIVLSVFYKRTFERACDWISKSFNSLLRII